MSKYDKVKYYYDTGRWTLDMVKNSVGKWITEEEYKSITGLEYQGE